MNGEAIDGVMKIWAVDRRLRLLEERVGRLEKDAPHVPWPPPRPEARQRLWRFRKGPSCWLLVRPWHEMPEVWEEVLP